MNNCLILNLTGPMMSFGLSRVGDRSPTDTFPGISMITGLLGNALGYERGHHQDLLNNLQSRLTIAARLNRQLRPQNFLTDLQTAQMAKENAWTNRGIPQRRSSGHHLLLRDYIVDAHITVAALLQDPAQEPTIDSIAHALQYPARPLFIGRSTCPPSEFIYQATTQSHSAIEALLNTPLPPSQDNAAAIRCRWATQEQMTNLINIPGLLAYNQAGIINWSTQLEDGWTSWYEGHIPREYFTLEAPSAPEPDHQA